MVTVLPFALIYTPYSSQTSYYGDILKDSYRTRPSLQSQRMDFLEGKHTTRVSSPLIIDRVPDRLRSPSLRFLPRLLQTLCHLPPAPPTLHPPRPILLLHLLLPLPLPHTAALFSRPSEPSHGYPLLFHPCRPYHSLSALHQDSGHITTHHYLLDFARIKVDAMGRSCGIGSLCVS